MIKLREDIDLVGYTLIVPSVAVGNVGQLVVDLFIASLSAKRIGYVWDAGFIPIVGPDPYDENSSDLCTAVDIYTSPSKKIVLIQIRSPPTKKPLLFFDQLQEFVTERKISKVIILTSSYSHAKGDVQIQTTPLRYVAAPEMKSQFGDQFKESGWIELEKKLGLGNTGEIHIPGGGFAKKLYETLTQKNIPSAILLRFCSEGDNIPDALELADYLNQWLDILPKDEQGGVRFTKPSSWKYLFGNDPPAEMF